MSDLPVKPFPILDTFLEMRKAIFKYFGHDGEGVDVEDRSWFDVPIEDGRQYYWRVISGEAYASIKYHEIREVVKDNMEGMTYEDKLCSQRFLPKLIYRAKDFTMICVDPNLDGDHYLQVFDNDKEVVVATET